MKVMSVIQHWNLHCRGDMSRVVFHSQPPVAACAPNFLGREALEELGQAAAKVLVPKKKPSKNTEKTEKKVKKKSKGMAGRNIFVSFKTLNWY